MNEHALLRRLEIPAHPIDVVLDTDTYNEIDDQFALAYLLKSDDKLHTKAIYAAPFFNNLCESPEHGMELSYQEILKLLKLMRREDMTKNVYRGSGEYLPNEQTPVISDAAKDLAQRAMTYTSENPLYVVSIGAITNVASALLLAPEIKDNIVIVWLGGHAHSWPHTYEFNMMQDIAAARVVFGCGAALIQLPCYGVVTEFAISGAELQSFIKGKNPLCDYLFEHTQNAVREYTDSPIWSRIIWDVTAVGWLLGGMMDDYLTPSPIPQYDHRYSFDPRRHPIRYVYKINRDALLTDLVSKLTRD